MYSAKMGNRNIEVSFLMFCLKAKFITVPTQRFKHSSVTTRLNFCYHKSATAWR